MKDRQGKLVKVQWKTIGDFQYNVATPSGRILHALTSMKLFEKAEGMGVDMDAYRKKGKLCLACCGGASRAVIEGWATPETFKDQCEFNNKFAPSHYEYSIDDFRTGNVLNAFDYMDLDTYKGAEFDRSITAYEHNPKQFYKDMRKLAADLFKAGY